MRHVGRSGSQLCELRYNCRWFGPNCLEQASFRRQPLMSAGVSRTQRRLPLHLDRRRDNCPRRPARNPSVHCAVPFRTVRRASIRLPRGGFGRARGYGTRKKEPPAHSPAALYLVCMAETSALRLRFHSAFRLGPLLGLLRSAGLGNCRSAARRCVVAHVARRLVAGDQLLDLVAR